MRRTIPIPAIGQRFGNLVVVDNNKTVGRRRACECHCDCGAVKTVRNEHLAKGYVVSCGCYRRKKAADGHRKHGGKGTRLYTIWKGMRERCNNPNSSGRKNYHDKGIRIYSAWDDFAAFRKWAIANGYRDDATLDRIDGNRGYGPDNCQWATRKEQTENRKNTIKIAVDGKEMTLMDFSRKTGIPYGTLYERLSHGNPLTKNKKRRTKK